MVTGGVKPYGGRREQLIRLATLSAEYGQDLAGLDVRDQAFLSDYAQRRAKFRVYEMASAMRLSNLPSRTKSRGGPKYYWEDYEKSVLDLFRTEAETHKAESVDRGWDYVRGLAERKGW